MIGECEGLFAGGGVGSSQIGNVREKQTVMQICVNILRSGIQDEMRIVVCEV